MALFTLDATPTKEKKVPAFTLDKREEPPKEPDTGFVLDTPLQSEETAPVAAKEEELPDTELLNTWSKTIGSGIESAKQYATDVKNAIAEGSFFGPEGALPKTIQHMDDYLQKIKSGNFFGEEGVLSNLYNDVKAGTNTATEAAGLPSVFSPFVMKEYIDKIAKGKIEGDQGLINQVAGDMTQYLEQSKARSWGFTDAATLNISKHLHEPVKPEYENQYMIGQLTGMLAPYGAAGKYLVNPIVKLASFSPIAPRAMMALANITGWGLAGAALGTVEDTFDKKELPTKEEILKHGATWMALEAGMGLLGIAGRFGKNLIGLAGLLGTTKKAVVETAAEAAMKRLKVRDVVQVKPEEFAKEVDKFVKDELKSIESGKQSPESIHVSKERKTAKAEAEKQVIEKFDEKAGEAKAIFDEKVQKLSEKDLKGSSEEAAKLKTKSDKVTESIEKTNKDFFDKTFEAEEKLTKRSAELRAKQVPKNEKAGTTLEKAKEKINVEHKKAIDSAKAQSDQAISQLSKEKRRKIDANVKQLDTQQKTAQAKADAETSRLLKNAKDSKEKLTIKKEAANERGALQKFYEGKKKSITEKIENRYAKQEQRVKQNHEKATAKADRIAREKTGKAEKQFEKARARYDKETEASIASYRKRLDATARQYEKRADQKIDKLIEQKKAIKKEDIAKSSQRLDKILDDFKKLQDEYNAQVSELTSKADAKLEAIDKKIETKRKFEIQVAEEDLKTSKAYTETVEGGYFPQSAGDAVTEVVDNFIGSKNKAAWFSAEKWNLEFKKRFPSQKARDNMRYYRERTGNPITGESFEQISNSLTDAEKRFVDEELDKHMKDVLERFNNNPYTKDIHAREFIQDIYIPHFYQGNSKKAYQGLSNKLKTSNPFSNKRTFATFNDALLEQGLLPRFKDLGDDLVAYESMLARIEASQKAARQLKLYQKGFEDKVVLTSKDKGYAEALKEGWIPFEDGSLRRYVEGKNANGKIRWGTTEAPALVHPAVSNDFAEIFIQQYEKPPKSWLAGQARDYASKLYRFTNTLAQIRVSGSLFHANTLLEAYNAAKGRYIPFVNTVQAFNDMKHMGQLMKNKEYMNEVLNAGLTLHAPEQFKLTGHSPISPLINRMEAKGGLWKSAAKLLKPADAVMGGFHAFTFGYLHPRVKLGMYYHYKNQFLKEAARKGQALSKREILEVNKKIAQAVNNQAGGQARQNVKFLEGVGGGFTINKKGNLGKMIAYPDWTLSTFKEVGDIFRKDLRGPLARRFWVNYLTNQFVSAQMFNMLFTSLEQAPDGSIRFNFSKARPTWMNGEPHHNVFQKLHLIQLPDIELNILGTKFNPGRDEKGRRLYISGGKKMKEISGWASHPVVEAFNKMNPGLQIAWAQMTGSTPGHDQNYYIDPKWENGMVKAWDGKDTLWEQLPSRTKHVFTQMLPFTFSSITNEGTKGWFKRFVSTAGGTLTQNKGVSLTTAQKYMYEALKDEDYESVILIKRALEGNGYETKQINRVESMAKNKVKKEKQNS